ncbi:hypothetical protein B0H13DRAFT_1850169 [Mycena leptocephala]|nr:hypothetical protein B0H13DRAFT_1850169 [Mycena leptocephala]
MPTTYHSILARPFPTPPKTGIYFFELKISRFPTLLSRHSNAYRVPRLHLIIRVKTARFSLRTLLSSKNNASPVLAFHRIRNTFCYGIISAYNTLTIPSASLLAQSPDQITKMGPATKGPGEIREMAIRIQRNGTVPGPCTMQSHGNS